MWTSSYDLGKELTLMKGDSEIVKSLINLSQPQLIDACALIEAKISLGSMMDPWKGKKKNHPSDSILLFLYVLLEKVY